MIMTKTDLDQEITTTGRKILIFLPAGITTTPAWLFAKFTTSSLAKHGIRRVSPGLRTFNPDGQVKRGQVEYVIRQDKSDSVKRINADTPISYQGWGRWS